MFILVVRFRTCCIVVLKQISYKHAKPVKALPSEFQVLLLSFYTVLFFSELQKILSSSGLGRES